MANLPFDIDNVKFLESAFHSVPNDAVPVVAAFRDVPGDGDGWKVFHPSDSRVKRQIGLAADQFNTYYCIASVAPNDPLTRRRDALRAVHVVVLDDIGTGAGAKKTPASVPLKPSAIIETSADNFQYVYFLDKPEEDLRKAQHLIREMSEEHGDAGGSMAGKLVRLPVGHNSKPSRLVSGQPFQVRLTAWEPELRYSLPDVAAAFKVDITSIPEMPAYSQGPRDLMGEPKHETKDAIFNWLLDNGYCSADIDHSGHVDVTCPWGDQHSDTNVGARYSPYGAGGEYAYQRQFTCFHEHCKDRTSSEFLQWVKQAGGPDLNAKMGDRFLEQYVYIGEGPRVGNLAHPGVVLTLHEFHETHKNKFYYGGKSGTQRIYYSRLWQESKDRLTVNALGWHPGESSVYDIRGMPYFNAYVDPTTGPETTDESLLDPIFAHLHYLFPQNEDYEHALDFIAWTRCKPEIRLQFALLHIAPFEGTGRGWLATLMRALFRRHYVTSGPPLQKMGSFNDYLYHSALVVFDEIHDKTVKFDVQNSIRTMITDRYQEINIKHGFKGTAEVFANIMFFSNHFDAMSIASTDRRVWVVINEAKPRPQAEYDMLYGLLENPVAVNQMYWFLRRRVALNPNSFDSNRPSKSTTAKRLLRTTNDDTFQAAVRATIERLALMGVKAIWKRHLRALIREEGITHIDADYEDRRLRHVLREFKVEEVYRARVPDEAVKLMGGGVNKDPIYALMGHLVELKKRKRLAHAEAMKTLRMNQFRAGPVGPNVLPFKPRGKDDEDD